MHTRKSGRGQTRYREKKYIAGNYMDVMIYPVHQRASGGRKCRMKPTSDIQTKLNEKNARMKLQRKIHANFTEHDMRFDMTYAPTNLPDSCDAALRELQNFIRRLKRYRKANCLPELKYIAVTEISKTGRYHHHLIINGGIDITVLARIWGRGYTQARPLQFDTHGVAALANYLTKGASAISKRWSASRNLCEPVVHERTGRISKKFAAELHDTPDDRNAFERLYPGYIFASCEPMFNEVDGHYYLHVYMYKIDKEEKTSGKHSNPKPKSSGSNRQSVKRTSTRLAAGNSDGQRARP